MSMKSQVNPIVPVAALVVATLAAGATMWHGLFAGVGTSPHTRGAAAAPTPGADAHAPQRPQDAGRHDAARAAQPPSAGLEPREGR